MAANLAQVGGFMGRLWPTDPESEILGCREFCFTRADLVTGREPVHPDGRRPTTTQVSDGGNQPCSAGVSAMCPLVSPRVSLHMTVDGPSPIEDSHHAAKCGRVWFVDAARYAGLDLAVLRFSRGGSRCMCK